MPRFSLCAPIVMLVNARYVIPVWRGKPFLETLKLFGGIWIVTSLMAGLLALGLWAFHYDLFLIGLKRGSSE